MDVCAVIVRLIIRLIVREMREGEGDLQRSEGVGRAAQDSGTAQERQRAAY